MKKALRLLVTSDIHGDSSQAKKLAEMAEKKEADLVIIAGDISYFDEHAKGVIGPFLERKKEVIFVPGNHDLATTKWIEEKYHIRNLQKYPEVVGDVGFFGCGGGDIGINLMDEDEIFRYLEKGFRHVRDAKKKVMITHMHPAGSEVERSSSFEGSRAVREAIEKFRPDFHICGHIHEAEGTEELIGKTKVICAGKKGRILDIYSETIK